MEAAFLPQRSHCAQSHSFNQSGDLSGNGKRIQCQLFLTQSCLAAEGENIHPLIGPITTIMKLHSAPTQQYQTVTAYDENGVELNAIYYSHSLIVLPEIKPIVWDVTTFDALTAADFEPINAQNPDVVIMGTGDKQRFIHPRLIAALTQKRIGVECMDNQAACRTYNILMAEGRKVALALIIEKKV